MFSSPQRLAELSARDDEHSKIGGARGAQFGGDGFARGELAGVSFEPGGERVCRAVGAGQNARREVGLQDIEIVDQGLYRGFLPRRFGRQAARGIAQLVEREAGADAVKCPAIRAASGCGTPAVA